LKYQIGQILEAISTLKSTNENRGVKNEEATSNSVVSQIGIISNQSHATQGDRMIHADFPPYGLPSGYVLPYKEYPEKK